MGMRLGPDRRPWPPRRRANRLRARPQPERPERAAQASRRGQPGGELERSLESITFRLCFARTFDGIEELCGFIRLTSGQLTINFVFPFER